MVEKLVKNLSLKMKLWLGCGSLLLILLITGGIGYKSALTTQKLATTVQFNTEKRRLSLLIQFALEREKVGGRDVLLHDDAANLADARADFQQRMATLQPLLTSPTSHRLFDQIHDTNDVYCRLADDAIQAHRSGDNAKALEIFYGPAAQQARADLKKSTVELVDWYGKLTADAQAEQIASTKQASLMILLLSLAGLGVGIAVALIVVRSLLHSIAPIVEILGEISKGNFCIPDLEIHTQDEIGQAAIAVNTLKGTLGGVVSGISLSAEQLASATEEIAASARQSSVNTQSQADQAFQVASAMQQMSATVREVSDHARKASEASMHSAQAARRSGEVAHETLATMQSIAASTSLAADRMVELGKSSREVGKIIDVITEIAGQTNLLALNAAIEAARAGEQGRGFAVVAGEVRRLAERTTAATQEIASMIQTIQSETRVAVEAIEKGNNDVALGVQKTNESGQALAEIISLSEEVGQMVAQIATAASQQNSATEQVNVSVSQISTLTQASSVNAGQTADACGNLASLAHELQRMVTQFCVDDKPRKSSATPPKSTREPAAPRSGIRPQRIPA
jgi:methyl-accepting chemotaxis protein